MNYGDLRTKFLARLNRRDCTTTLADGFLQDAITRVQRALRVPSMERGVSITTDNATYYTNGYLAIPVNYLRMKELSVTLADGSKRSLLRRPLSYVQENIVTRDYPVFYARQGAGLVLSPTPLSGTVIRIDYWSEFPTTSAITDSTNLTDVASDLILFGALSYAADHWNDKRGDRFEARFGQILTDVQGMADDDELMNAEVEQALLYPDDGNPY